MLCCFGQLLFLCRMLLLLLLRFGWNSVSMSLDSLVAIELIGIVRGRLVAGDAPLSQL